MRGPLRPLIMAAAIALAGTSSAFGQAPQRAAAWAVQAGIVGFESGVGIDFTAGISGHWRRVVAGGFVGALMLPQAEDSRYYRDDLGNGQSRCRDSETGRFASDSLCGPSFEPTASVEAGLRIAGNEVAQYVIAAGMRAGSPTTPYGVAEVRLGGADQLLRGFNIRMAGGENFFTIGATYLFGNVGIPGPRAN